MMSTITIHLDPWFDDRLKQFCDSTASTPNEAIRALIKVTLHDSYIRSNVANDQSSLHPASPWRSAITVDLDNLTGVDLKQWYGEVDPADAIEAMVRVMIHDKTIRERVSLRLPRPSIPVVNPVKPEPVKKHEPGGPSPV
jgi:(2Fe-2S) ferredoxin